MRKILLLGLMFFCSLEAVQFSLGLRTDNLQWGFSRENIEYQSQWKKLRLANLGVEGKIDKHRAYLKAAFNYGWVYEGKYQPLGFVPGCGEFLDDLPASKRANGGAWDFIWGVGYKYKRSTFQFAPMLGWAHQYTHFFTGTYLAVDGFSRRSSSTKFHSRWSGLWIGFDSAYEWDSSLSLDGSFRFHTGSQHGEQLVYAYTQSLKRGMSIGRFPFKFTIDNFLMGVFIAGGAHYKINRCWDFGFHVDYWDLQEMIDIAGFTWDSLRFNLDLSYRF